MKHILFIIFLLFTFNSYAQDLKSLFIAIPDSLSPLLTKVNREDFGDFLDSNMKAEVRNRFGNTSEMKKLTSDYLLLQTSSASITEMKLLPVNDSTKIICIVNTYMAPVADSQISFYDTSWRKLSHTTFLQLPEEKMFYKPAQNSSQADSLKNLQAAADMYLLQAKLSENNTELSFTYTTPQYLDKETAQKLTPFLRNNPLTYEWINGKFVPSENKLSHTGLLMPSQSSDKPTDSSSK